MSHRPRLATSKEIWRVADAAGEAPARGWSLYAARFRRMRSITRGGVRWRVEHTLEASSDRFFSAIQITAPQNLSPAVERKLRAKHVFDSFHLAAHSLHHRGGWWLGGDGISGRWLEELYSPERALTAWDALERVLAKRRPSSFVKRPPIRQVIPRSDAVMGARISKFLQLMRGIPEGPSSLVALGFHRRARLTVNGRRWLTIRAAWVLEEGTLAALQLEPEGAPPTAGDRRRIGASLTRAGFSTSWHPFPDGSWTAIYTEGPEPRIVLTDAVRRLDDADLGRLLR